MGRKPTKPNAVPRLRVRVRGGKRYYFYDHGGRPRREESLGCDYGLAIKRWAEIEHDQTRVPDILTFRYVAERYRIEVMPTKAPATQKSNAREIGKLIEFFDDPPAPLDAIEPHHIRKYMRWRSATKTAANREKALFSHIWNWARNQGYTKFTNPCQGVDGYTESGRNVYIEDDAFAAVWNAADAPLRDALDLAYLTGQRPADTLRMAETDIKDGHLQVRQGKTGKALRIAIVGELSDLLDRIAARKSALPVRSLRLIINENGQPLGRYALRFRFDNARKIAGIAAGAFQFRDLRAKAGTDKADASGDVRAAQRQLGHASVVMTEHYVRERRGDKVTPTR